RICLRSLGTAGEMLPLAAEFWNGSGATLISTGFSNIKTRADPASVIRKKALPSCRLSARGNNSR
ncbi:hypothetical protein ABTB07_22705, partial [Acinetobacter baumannii]